MRPSHGTAPGKRAKNGWHRCHCAPIVALMADRDYVLGTHEAEIARLGLQHRVWQQHAMRAWRRAGIGAGQTVLDIGAGPGYASIDLADLVGPTGAVIAIERSGQFAAAAKAAAQSRGMTQIAVREADLLETDLGTSIADATSDVQLAYQVYGIVDLGSRAPDATTLIVGGYPAYRSYLRFALP